MRTPKKSSVLITEKFQKKDKICNICQQEKELSIDHVPPQACPPAKSRVISKLLYQMIGDTSFRPRHSQIRGRFRDYGFFNLIKFYPLAFLITHQLPNYEGLSSLHQFNQLLPGEKRNVQINLRSMRHSRFPEECSDKNLLVFARTARDSVHSVPKAKKRKGSLNL